MKRRKRIQRLSDRKRKSKIWTTSLIILGILLAVSLTWVGMHGWNLEKSVLEVNKIIGLEKKEEHPESKNTSEDLEGEPHDTGSTEEDRQEKTEASSKEEENRRDSSGYIEGMELPDEPTYIDGILIANKENPLPSTFAPGESEEARKAFEKLAAEAVLSDFKLTAFSTYRSFEYQTDLYDRYVERDGKEEADRYSARPGYSEHQTGLAFDIGEENYEQFWADEKFGETEAAKWLAANAHRFGFIMRYPLDKEDVTGYMHESWHYRYIGTEIATEIYEKEMTLEEYVGLN